MHIIDRLRALANSDKSTANKAEANKFVDAVEQHYFELFGKDTLGVSESLKTGEKADTKAPEADKAEAIKAPVKAAAKSTAKASGSSDAS